MIYTEETPKGWECPRCHCVHGPHVERCKHCDPRPGEGDELVRSGPATGLEPLEKGLR